MNPKRHRRASSILKPTKPIENERPPCVDVELVPRPATHTRLFTALYYVTVATMVAMVSVEIALLSNKDVGIGLVPFSYVGLIAVLANRLQWKTRGARAANVGFWMLLGIALTLKVAAAVIESDRAAEGGGEKSRTYPGDDGIVVVSVMAGSSFALAVLEFAGWTGLERTA
ncbi:tdt family transporter [Diplodia corticola]|uniref:Tdt family transporter n=1 Tax=Diplodia corticola TaxID=236234 RepID=A0A1J9RQY5_9PEZI|nr:tdt family transporter [Diplodia corticola]OJD30847.1 tdt family transporter [Diplodia corticola]